MNKEKTKKNYEKCKRIIKQGKKNIKIRPKICLINNLNNNKNINF